MNTCVMPHHGDQPPLSEPSLMVCRTCYQRLRQDLHAITTLWPLLAVMVTPGNGGNNGGASGKPGSRPPCDLDILDITDQRGTVSQQIGGWARIVIEERQLSATPADAEQAARLLTIHADWVAAQPWADEAAQEIHDAAYAIRRACRDLPDPPLGKCPDIDPRGEADRCGGPMRWADGTATVVCARCGSSWGEADMPNLLRVLEPARRFPVPRDWVVSRYAVTAVALRQWVRRGHVKTYPDEQVELFDVLKRVQEG